MSDSRLIELTADIVSAHVSNNTIPTTDVPALITSVFTALTKAETPAPVEEPKKEPAVAVRASIKPDYLVCLEDGAKLKMLKRYLRTNFDMSPEEYRAKWKLPRDYPMVAPNYANQRRELAVQIGLGRGGKRKLAAAVPAPVPVVKKAPAAKKAATAPAEVKAKSKAPAKKPASKKASVEAVASE